MSARTPRTLLDPAIGQIWLDVGDDVHAGTEYEVVGTEIHEDENGEEETLWRLRYDTDAHDEGPWVCVVEGAFFLNNDDIRYVRAQR